MLSPSHTCLNSITGNVLQTWHKLFKLISYKNLSSTDTKKSKKTSSGRQIQAKEKINKLLLLFYILMLSNIKKSTFSLVLSWQLL